MISSLIDKADGFVPWKFALFGIILSSYWSVKNSFSDDSKLGVVMIFVLMMSALVLLQLMRLYDKKTRNSIELVADTRTKIIVSSSVEEAYNNYVNFVGAYKHPLRDMPSCICDLVCKKRG
jgi:hypothetical protein